MEAPLSTVDALHTTDAFHSLHGPVCPRCNSTVYRVPRRFVDRLLSAFMRVFRYRCDAMGCNWEGNLRVTGRP